MGKCEWRDEMKIYLEQKKRSNMVLCLGTLAAVLFSMLTFPFSAHAGPVMQVDAESYSAGEVYAGEVVEHRFSISNVGDEPLEVQRVRSS